jgi:hypothetical protein
MNTIFDLITLECQSEHDLEHKIKLSTPKPFKA